MVSGALVLDNAPLPKVTLGTDPLETTSGSVTVKVYHEGHGFSLGDDVAISGVANAIGGVAASEFNGTFDIKSVNWDGYTIEVVTDPLLCQVLAVAIQLSHHSKYTMMVL